jgi:hypothetical protein
MRSTEKAINWVLRSGAVIFFLRGGVYPVIRCLAREEFVYMGSHEAESSADLPHLSLNATPEALHSTPEPDPQQSPEELKEEQRKIRRLQMMMNMVMSVIGQDL